MTSGRLLNIFVGSLIVQQFHSNKLGQVAVNTSTFGTEAASQQDNPTTGTHTHAHVHANTNTHSLAHSCICQQIRDMLVIQTQEIAGQLGLEGRLLASKESVGLDSG